MDERDALAARIASLEGEVRSVRATLGRLEAWAARFGVVTPTPQQTVPAPIIAASDSTVAASAVAAPIKKPLSADQLLIRVMYGIGLLLLLVGGSIFLAAIAYLGPGVRTLLGIGVGLVLLVPSVRAKNRTWQADGALALGAGLEYLSLWYAHTTGIVPLVGSALTMVAVTGLLYALGYLYRSERIALAGLLGGSITPLLLADTSPDFLSLNVYLLVLSGAALALAALRSFRYVEVATVCAIAFYATQWSFTYSDTWHPLEALAAASCYLIELCGALLYGVRNGRATIGKRLLLSIELFAFALFLQEQAVDAATIDVIGFRVMLLAFAVVCLIAARLPKLDGNLRAIFGWWSAGCVMLELQAAVPSPIHIGALAVEGAVLSMLATHDETGKSKDLLRIGSALCFVSASVFAILAYLDAPGFFAVLALADAQGFFGAGMPFFNAPFVQLAALPLALLAAIQAQADSDRSQPWTKLLCVALHVSASLALATQAYLIVGPVPFRALAVTAALTAYAVGLLVAGVRLHRGLLRALGAAFFLVVVCKIFAVDLSGLDPLVRVFSFVGVGIVLVSAAAWYARLLSRDAAGTQAAP